MNGVRVFLGCSYSRMMLFNQVMLSNQRFKNVAKCFSVTFLCFFDRINWQTLGVGTEKCFALSDCSSCI